MTVLLDDLRILYQSSHLLPARGGGGGATAGLAAAGERALLMPCCLHRGCPAVRGCCCLLLMRLDAPTLGALSIACRVVCSHRAASVFSRLLLLLAHLS